jgi:hypothetical protein
MYPSKPLYGVLRGNNWLLVPAQHAYFILDVKDR